MRARATSSSSIALSMPNGQQAGKERPAVAEEEGATDNAALRRKAYVDAGREAFLDAGFGATTMSSIAALVGGSKTTLWTYFPRSEEHTSELQSLMRISYAVFCLKNKTHHSLN